MSYLSGIGRKRLPHQKHISTTYSALPISTAYNVERKVYVPDCTS
jgi:hypothetical protein